MKALVVIPTYNEKENIAKLIGELMKVNGELEVLVVDDGSPDGTGEIVRALARENERVHVIHRPGKMGLGTAYITGFRYALKRPDIECILEMDADFSHQPKYIKDFLREIKEYDVVLGSRYIPGGGVENWGWSRRLLSKGGSLFARLVLGLPYRDCTGGFRCYRRQVLEQIDLNTITSEGFGFQVEMLYACHQNKFRIKEIPIIFPDRREGTSKISRKIVLEAFCMVLKLRILHKQSFRKTLLESPVQARGK
ncbi:polyprenol monophosphomannose synthase [Thermincola potens]|uniref:Dolichyl-phosphate beta-D-mannosyltransferase n=1 Tax=Thermincola potens (strain JR) TaxID=635013 RepID=D5XF47_THEPJ|nr:polyprenol monophosphomannose synthase [Thermincola potens]ADG82268.1 Dolichyl-phosphate beta-D-mannosyltransferase [Thermincola potens JR]